MLSRTRFIPAPSCHIVRARGFHRPAPAAAGGLLGKLFGGRKPEEPKSSETSSPAVGDSVSESGTGTENMGAEQTRLEALASRAPNESIQPKFPKRAYSPARLDCFRWISRK
ncbi:hypothetical protein GQ54DRAFT_46148 [Martensiomyces pterosporus]|nr:hypothetical protein GQ54DRAFT_46148 [Martensiomyces pterosporus]